MHFFDVGRKPDLQELPNLFSNYEHKLYSVGPRSTTTTAVSLIALVRDSVDWRQCVHTLSGRMEGRTFCFRRHGIIEKSTILDGHYRLCTLPRFCLPGLSEGEERHGHDWRQLHTSHRDDTCSQRPWSLSTLFMITLCPRHDALGEHWRLKGTNWSGELWKGSSRSAAWLEKRMTSLRGKKDGE
jgi:hypothetical protein